MVEVVVEVQLCTVCVNCSQACWLNQMDSSHGNKTDALWGVLLSVCESGCELMCCCCCLSMVEACRWSSTQPWQQSLMLLMFVWFYTSCSEETSSFHCPNIPWLWSLYSLYGALQDSFAAFFFFLNWPLKELHVLALPRLLYFPAMEVAACPLTTLPAGCPHTSQFWSVRSSSRSLLTVQRSRLKTRGGQPSP